MTPSFYPDIGFFEVVKNVDAVVLHTDVCYAKRKINRTLLRDNRWLSLHVERPEKRTPLHEVKVKPFDEWHKGLMERLVTVYGSDAVRYHPLFEEIEEMPKHGNSILFICYKSIRDTLKYYNISTNLINSRECGVNGKKGQEKIIEICKWVGAFQYLHRFDGRRSYDPVAFARQGIEFREFEPKDKTEFSVLDDAFSWFSEYIRGNEGIVRNRVPLVQNQQPAPDDPLPGPPGTRPPWLGACPAMPGQCVPHRVQGVRGQPHQPRLPDLP